jgi:hypothetical protein
MSKSWHPGEPDEDWGSYPYNWRMRGQRHRDGPMSDRERSVWTFVWWGLGLLVFAMLLYMLLH